MNSVSAVLKLKYFVRLFLIIAVVESFIMLFLANLPVDNVYIETMFDTVLLVLLTYPLLYFFVVRPFSADLNYSISDQLEHKTKDLHELNMKLEQKVEEKTMELSHRNDELHAIWNLEKNMMIFTDGQNLLEANRAFFDFFSEYQSLEEFKQAHACICDFFEKRMEEGYVYKDIDNLLWTDYILEHSDTFLKVAIPREQGIHVFSVHADRILQKNEHKTIVTFNEITELENYQDFLESYQDTLEEKIKEEAESLRKKDKIMLTQSRQAAMGDMISMIAHQWRQPITAIGMSAQNMMLDIELDEIDPERFETKLEKIVDQTHFLSRTIDDFRDFLKPIKKPVSCRLSDLINGTLSIIGKSLEHNDVRLETSFGKDIKITTFCNEVIQVLLNILGNAKDIVKIKGIKGALVQLTVSNDEKYVHIKICDNAGGIQEDVLPKIFEPYFTTKESKGGTGLGLYMSHMIVEKHLGGEITVENRNGGACFTLILPIKLRAFNDDL